MKKPFKYSLLTVGILAAISVTGCGGGGEPSPFTFATASPDMYVRVDRMGQPAVATALLSRTLSTTLNPPNLANTFDDQRDALNRGDPINDVRDFAALFTDGPQSNSLRNIHFEVGPQLRSLGLTPCSVETVVTPSSNADVNIDGCVAQVAPVVLPDVVTYDLNAAAGWPNGRSFDDPVVDRLLAAALLDLSVHNINTLFGVINTTLDETGVPSPTAFPHLRAKY